VTCVFLTVGTSTRKLALLQSGDDVPVFVGPLGNPPRSRPMGRSSAPAAVSASPPSIPSPGPLRPRGTGSSRSSTSRPATFSIGRTSSAASATVFIVSTRDGEAGGTNAPHYIAAELESLIAAEPRIDRVIAIGCTYLMSPAPRHPAARHQDHGQPESHHGRRHGHVRRLPLHRGRQDPLRLRGRARFRRPCRRLGRGLRPPQILFRRRNPVALRLEEKTFG